ncbi:DNA replication/repair protein RecF [Candidatus Sumerlaeota bacterium]|nr:DNA replication/repair protein RecF [Candidatus Sumerlaeota bacterium]
MYLSNIEIRNFRNIQEVQLQLSPSANIITGGNAQGKTNFLEAIYCLLKGRSFRTGLDRDCLPVIVPAPVSTEQTIAVIKGSLVKQDVSHPIRFILTGEAKRLYYDGKVIKRLADYWSETAVVVFTPEDLSIVKGTPANRRKFLDVMASQLWQPYITNLVQFNALLKSRNAFLRQVVDGYASIEELENWDKELAIASAHLFCYRWQLIEKLQSLAPSIYRSLSNENESLSLHYENFLDANEPLSFDEARQFYLELLVARRELDLERGITTTGPQRDELSIFVNGLDARSFGSQGQQRSIVVSLRCAEALLMKEFFSDTPILLLDDVLSELDARHRECILKTLPKDSQIFLTTTDADIDFGSEWLNVMYFTAHQGKISKR